MRPDDSGTLNNYAWLLATAPDEAARNGELALKYAQKASDLTNNKESHILSTLGAAYAETGDFDKALECANKAVEIGEKQNVDRLDDLKKEPESYLKKQPWRETPEKANVETTESEEDEEDLFDSADEETEEDANSAAAEEAVGTLEPVNNAEADAAAEENPPEDRPMGVPAADAGEDGENN